MLSGLQKDVQSVDGWRTGTTTKSLYAIGILTGHKSFYLAVLVSCMSKRVPSLTTCLSFSDTEYQIVDPLVNCFFSNSI